MSSEETGMLVRDGFRCPICGFDAYCRIVLIRSNHSRYVNSFYRCGGCQIVFFNPQTFSANGVKASANDLTKPAQALAIARSLPNGVDPESASFSRP